MLDVKKKNTLLTFKGIRMNVLMEFNFFISSHPLTSEQPRKMHHPVEHQKDCQKLDILTPEMIRGDVKNLM